MALPGEVPAPLANGTSHHMPENFLGSDGARRTLSLTGSEAVRAENLSEIAARLSLEPAPIILTVKITSSGAKVLAKTCLAGL